LDLNCLLWADDLVIFSQTAEGLQNSINKTKHFYDSLGLKINEKKTKIMIFNKSGKTLKNKHNFWLGGKPLEVTDQYQYLGLKLRPSGALNFSVDELNLKANKAWFSISKILYKHKRMEVDKSLRIFDSLVSPVATYGCEFWLPHCLPSKAYKSRENFLNSWENFAPEKVNQKCCRLLLSVHKKTSRLAVLGELGRHPLFIKSVAHCLNYKLHLNLKKDPKSILSNLMTEMRSMADKDQDCWLTCVQNMEKLLNSPKLSGPSKTSGKCILSFLRTVFEKFWHEQVNKVKLGPDNKNHNKLRTYSTLKQRFGQEPYVNLVRNRNQRMHLTHLRISAHNLGIERGRYRNIPIEERFCSYCSTHSTTGTTPPPQPGTPASRSPSATPSSPPHAPSVDTEFHFLNQCPTFQTNRNCFYGKFSSLDINFSNLNDEQKFVRLLCPKTAEEAKLTNKFIKIMCEWREKIDDGFSIDNLGIYFVD
jgi:hypothetical protein